MRARSRIALATLLAPAALVAVAPGARAIESATGAAPPAAQDQPSSGGAVNRTYRGPGLKAFKAGHRAWELHDWKKTLVQMSLARKADLDQPEAQVRLPGVFMSPYIPKYYESHALCHLGHCSEARRDMDEVLKLIKDAPDYLRNRYTRDCQKACPRPLP